jgi:hypothetical protein
MSLIDASYFVGELNIPNTSSQAIAERLQFFIAKYERQFLEDLLGYELWKLLDTQITQGEENSPATPLPRLASLLDGVEYTDSSVRLRKWQGLVYTEGGLPRSLIANFVYWHWMKDQVTQTTGLGEAATQAQNATLVSPTGKMVSAWNEMAKMVAHLHYFLNDKQADYPEWVGWSKWPMYMLAANVNQFGI